MSTKTESHNIEATYTVGRKVVNESGDHVVEKQERQVAVDIQKTEDGRYFFRGARLA